MLDSRREVHDLLFEIQIKCIKDRPAVREIHDRHALVGMEAWESAKRTRRAARDLGRATDAGFSVSRERSCRISE